MNIGAMAFFVLAIVENFTGGNFYPPFVTGLLMVIIHNQEKA